MCGRAVEAHDARREGRRDSDARARMGCGGEDSDAAWVARGDADARASGRALFAPAMLRNPSDCDYVRVTPFDVCRLCFAVY